MQIMLSRTIDTRAVYIIGVSTLLALSENVFPTYFRALPPTIQSFTNSPLALGLTFAIGLTLLFRLGTRQTDEVRWSDSTESINSVMAFLRQKAQAWHVNASVMETSLEHASRVIHYILSGHSTGRGGILRASYNGVDLRLEIIYEGSRTEQLPASDRTEVLVENELENEESAAYVGLQNFLRGLVVDRQQVKTRGGQIIIRLFYAI
jgi:hypothetical protein